jgi:hypothetical protein
VLQPTGCPQPERREVSPRAGKMWTCLALSIEQGGRFGKGSCVDGVHVYALLLAT